MLLLRSHHWLAFFLAISLVNALPLLPRQSSMSFTTVETTSSGAVQTCVVTLTPITDDNGQPAVVEVKQCTITVNNANQSTGASSAPPSNSAPASVPAPAASNSAPPPAVPPPVSSTSAASGGTVPSSTPAPASPTPSASAGGSSVSASPSGIPTIPVSGASSSTTLAATSAPAPIPTPSQSGSTGPDNNAADPSSAAPASSSNIAGSAAAAETTDPAATFTLPGKKLSVLPIGLGVFAGISVIALIVVGLVTFERTKYRKAFRQRKLAESGAGMGYGGMAQRP